MRRLFVLALPPRPVDNGATVLQTPEADRKQPWPCSIFSLCYLIPLPHIHPTRSHLIASSPGRLLTFNGQFLAPILAGVGGRVTVLNHTLTRHSQSVISSRLCICTYSIHPSLSLCPFFFDRVGSCRPLKGCMASNSQWVMMLHLIIIASSLVGQAAAAASSSRRGQAPCCHASC